MMVGKIVSMCKIGMTRQLNRVALCCLHSPLRWFQIYPTQEEIFYWNLNSAHILLSCKESLNPISWMGVVMANQGHCLLLNNLTYVLYNMLRTFIFFLTHAIASRPGQ